ncbi:MAG: DNA methyltransferase [Promethearchaeota archaeon]
MAKKKGRKPIPAERRLNELGGKEWTRYSISVWDLVKTAEERKLKHPAMFPGELCERLIKIYTKPGMRVLDPFAGVGSVVVAARKLGRDAVGLELNPDFVDTALRWLSGPPPAEGTEQVVHNRDAREVAEVLPGDSVDLCVTSPPYWDILRRKRTADYKESRPYSPAGQDMDLGNLGDYSEFLGELGRVFGGVIQVLKPGKKCVVVVMDIRKKSKFYPFHVDVLRTMEGVGFVLEDIIIWDRHREYNSLRPLGYPTVFVVNKVHEYILIFRKKKVGEE